MSGYGSQAQAYVTNPAWRGDVHEAPQLEVVRGGGLDAEARRSVSPGFVRVLRYLALAVVLFFACGMVRVAISIETVGSLDAAYTLRSQIARAEQLNSDLKIERSVLSSSSRIARIATQNLGMVLPATHDRIALPTEDFKRGLAEARPTEGWTDEVPEGALVEPEPLEAPAEGDTWDVPAEGGTYEPLG